MTKTAPQTAAESTDGDEREPGRAYDTFTFKDREIELYEPVAGQRFILLQTVGVTDEGASDVEKLELIIGFSQMLRALTVKQSDRMFMAGALARGTADLEDYFGLARQMADAWSIEAAPANRAERRTPARRPAKAVPLARGRR